MFDATAGQLMVDFVAFETIVCTACDGQAVYRHLQ